MIVDNPTGPVSPNQVFLIASKLGVDANALATTVLDWQNGASAATTFPMYARVSRASGTLALMVASLRLNATIIQPISAVQSALLGAAAAPLIFSVDTNTSATVIPNTGNYDVVVGTINGGASTIDIYVYGLKVA